MAISVTGGIPPSAPLVRVAAVQQKQKRNLENSSVPPGGARTPLRVWWAEGEGEGDCGASGFVEVASVAGEAGAAG